MEKTTVVNIYKDRNFDEYIGRAGKGQDGYFGNPFKTDDRQYNIKMFRAYFRARMKSDPVFKSRVMELKGKKLGCFCKPLACHGDIIAEFLNGNK